MDPGCMEDLAFMEQAVVLARNGLGRVDPNPLVGCVVVKDSKVIGEGWHHAFGCPHAEREALADCRQRGNDPRGAIVYVTLEPCCHAGKTPPCTDALIESGIARVVVGSPDPNPLVAGKGVDQLRVAGVQVEEGVARAACDSLNKAFFKHVVTGMPRVTAKWAMTLDGKVATRTGASRWITGPEARMRVHQDRASTMAVLAGVGTVLADDPLLTCRLEGQDASCVRQPVRVVLDSHLRTPLDSALVRSAADGTAPLLLYALCEDANRAQAYEGFGCEVVSFAKGPSHVDVRAVLADLGARGINSVIVEGGPSVLGAFFDQGLVDAVQVYVAPKVFGGKAAPSPVAGLGVVLPDDGLRLDDVRFTRLGADLLIEGEVAACSPA